MKDVKLIREVQFEASDVYDTLCDFQQFERHCDSVIAVDVKPISDEVCESSWRVHFHDGEMHWTEQNRFDKDNLAIHFQQLEGDADEFFGTWQIEAVNDGLTRITFVAHVSLGIDTLAAILDPIAAKAITENINVMIDQLFTRPNR